MRRSTRFVQRIGLGAVTVDPEVHERVVAAAAEEG
jgi:hypothetical protein